MYANYPTEAHRDNTQTDCGVEVSASCSSIRCPGMRITVDVLCGIAGLTDDDDAADWLAVSQSTASDMTFMLLWSTPAWTFWCIVAFSRCQHTLHTLMMRYWGRQWHQLDHMQTTGTSLQTDNHTNTPSLNSYRLDALPDAQPTVSKHWSDWIVLPLLIYRGLAQNTYTCISDAIHKQYKHF